MLYASYSTTPFQSDDDGFSGTGMSSDYEDDPQDQRFAFRRKANVQYLAPITTDEMMDIDDDLPDFNLFVPNPKESRYKYAFIFEIVFQIPIIFNYFTDIPMPPCQIPGPDFWAGCAGGWAGEAESFWIDWPPMT